MPHHVFCECCQEFVTPHIAKKHRREQDQEQHFQPLGHTLANTDPFIPITTESLFGPTFLPPLDNFMDVDDAIPPTNLPPLSPVPLPDFLFVSHRQDIPDDDFEPEDTSGNQELLEPYDEDFERVYLEEEEEQAQEDLNDFAEESEPPPNIEGIQYGLSHFN